MCYINLGTRIERKIGAVPVIVPIPLKCIDDVIIALVFALSYYITRIHLVLPFVRLFKDMA